MRIVITGLIGGIVFFFWGFVAHMLLPIGEMGIKQAANEDVVLSALREGLPGEGVYLLPGMTPEQMNDPVAKQAYSEKAKVNPFAFVVYQPVGKDWTDMSGALVKQFAMDTLSALMVAFVLALGAFSFSKRVLISAVLGLFSWLTISVPYWNWYRFPLDFTLGSLLEQVVGWTIAGIAMAVCLRRKRR